MWIEDKNGVKTPVCFSEPSAYCCGSYFPYESELSTESPHHISSGAHATQKNKLAINRDKPLGLAKTVDSTRKIHTAINMSLMFFLFIARLLASAALLHQSICLMMDVESLLS